MYSPQSTTLLIETVKTDLPFSAIFARVAHQPYALLFDSAGEYGELGRFKIMVFDPVFSVECKAGETALIEHSSGSKSRLDMTPFEAVKHLQHPALDSIDIESQVAADTIAALPFLIGTAGLAGYDSGRFYEQLPSQAAHQYACPDFAVGLYEQSLIQDTKTGSIYSCRLSHRPNISWLVDAPLPSAAPFALTSPWQSNLSKQDYLQALDAVHHYLRAGDCYQVNMAQRFSAQYNGDEWQGFQALSEANEAPFSAFMRLPTACVMSISPERFIAVRNKQVETRPIKGTRPRSDDIETDRLAAESLLQAEKDRAENLMIVDLLRNDLSKHCLPHSVQVPALFALESYAAVHHMVSTVVGQLKPDASPFDLLAGAFPGGSITGAPKIRAMEIIEELEPHRRNVYCGSLFYCGYRQDMDSSILIRTLLAENGTLHCWAGGGIVLDSVPQEEYQETLDKVARILPVLERLS
ncbi:aminodeoxychorismate synthase component I [Alteromonas sp. C1M14]|uniref:aminodeoxychorismate synthase component I n=1 Tax=Alteromonas sp. C1M14 TaxID=2841567 RepID=UPI001C09ECC8|nr:aminodeoxychorismate synthase component I [Alteromonas sp. C1M14]MBU2976919.1 aminodeoxychorismate synthase component I [Alteromonas sp. C1M14]